MFVLTVLLLVCSSQSCVLLSPPDLSILQSLSYGPTNCTAAGVVCALQSDGSCRLEEVPSLYILSKPQFSQVQLVALKRVPGWIYIQNNANLTLVDLPALESCNVVDVNLNPLVESVNLPSLVNVADYVDIQSPQISSLSFPQLEYVGDDFEFGGALLATVFAPRLETVGASFLISSRNLSAVEIPKLNKVAAAFSITIGSQALVINATSLAAVGECLQISDAGALVYLESLKSVGYGSADNCTSVVDVSVAYLCVNGSTFADNRVTWKGKIICGGGGD